MRAFRHRNYRLFFSGQLVSLVGTWMQAVAQSWLVYRLTGSELLLGFVGFASQLPVFLLATVGGAVADRSDRRRILLATQAAAMTLALALAVLAFSGHVAVWHVFVLATCLGVVNAFDIPARSAFLLDLVGRDDLMNAIALNSSMVNGARIVGPALAGAALAAVGEAWCFLGNGISFVAVIAGLLAMRDIAKRARPAQTRGTAAQIAEGFRFVLRERPVGALLALLGIVSLVGMPYAVLMPAIADRTLHAGAGGLGALMACSGVGALAAALLLAARTSMLGLGRWVVVSAGAFGLSLVAFSFAARTGSLALAGATLVPVGFCMMLQMSASNTLVQAMTPDALRGRVMAVYSMMFMGMTPFGALLAGAVSHRVGSETTIAFGGSICMMAAGAFGAALPRLQIRAREVVRALRAAAAAEPSTPA